MSGPHDAAPQGPAPVTGALRPLAWLWAAPASIVGLAFALPLVARGARCAIVDGVLEVAASSHRRRHHRRPRFGAITFGHVVLGRDAATLSALRVHERVHVAQYERLGPLFLPLYALSSAFAWARGGDPYRDNRFEREAFACAPPAPAATRADP